MKAKRESAGQRGSALLEVLIAAVVLGIAIIGVSLIVSSAQTMVVGQGGEWTALYLAQEKIELCIASPFGTCSSSPPETITAGESGSQTFTRVTTVTNPSGNPDIQQVSVTVTPAFKKADPATLVTVLTNH